MNIRDSRPFILSEGSRLTIPSGIKSRPGKDGGINIPLTIIEKGCDVYHFIPQGSQKPEDMILFVPGSELPEKKVTVTKIDFNQRRALAELA